MNSRNAGEAVRYLEEGRMDILHRMKLPITKGEKALLLQRLRLIEDELNIFGINYNSTSFGEQLES